jgi:hypothetical protein
MGEARRRAAQHAAGTNPPAGKLKVSNRIDVVPMDTVESYLKHEIVSEGRWRSGVPLVIVRPAADRGLADSQWLPEMVTHMRETRRRYGPIPFTLGLGETGGIDLDIGLIDIIVFFEYSGSKAFVRPETQAESDRLLHENLRHIDMLCADALHDQMVIAIAPHVYHSNGSLLYHYHNLIFGLRHEARGDMDVFGTLDLEPLMKKLSASGPLRIVGGMRQ